MTMLYENLKYKRIVRVISLSISILIPGCSPTKTALNGPVYVDSYHVQREVVARFGGVVSASPIASKVGLAILKKGGNAIDAAIAVQLALAVVYPEAGNIGGGGFMVMHLKDGTNKALDFREKAPASTTKNMYLDEQGNPVTIKSLAGHLASGIPGTIAGIFDCLPYAKLPFKDLIQPAIDLAEMGYVLSGMTAIANPIYNTRPNVFDGSHHLGAGDTLRQPELAATLKRIRDRGRKEFYQGKTAQLIVAEMKRGGGNITLKDLKNYKAIWRVPHQFIYRGYNIISMPLPSSGGILLHQMLGMIEHYPLASYGFGSARAINLIIEAERRAYRDRAQYLGDGDYAKVPVDSLVGGGYLDKQMSDFVPGHAGKSTPIGAGDQQKESLETTHFSIVDQEGNAVSVTTTLNMPYGSQVVVGGAGFFLNNEMNDFSLKPGVRNASGGVGGINNAIAPGKRMLSSMTPTIVLKDGKIVMVLGSPGGTTIPTSVLQTIVDIIDFKMSPSDAVNQPKFHHEWLPDQISMEDGFPVNTISALKSMGYKIMPAQLGRVEFIVAEHGNWDLVADHRGGKDSAEGY